MAIVPCPSKPRLRSIHVFAVALGLWAFLAAPQARSQGPTNGQPAPEIDPGTEWFGVDKPLALKDLRGKFVILDFWTLCCINCIHLLPDLAALERKYPGQLVVIGIHTPKFENERRGSSVKKAILRYEIKHPVMSDADRKNSIIYQTTSWPTVFLIDPEGNLVGKIAYEKVYAQMDAALSRLIPIHRAKRTLNEQLLSFQTAMPKKHEEPLLFPGKVLADAQSQRLFISDSTNHRIVITDLQGKKIAVAGTGLSGRSDGPFAKAQFSDPQGLALRNGNLYVADRKNNLIRALDLKANTVRTIAGTGLQGLSKTKGGAALNVGLNSPWGLYVQKDVLFIGMAGHHQIWAWDLLRSGLVPFAGSGMEEIIDGTRALSAFAQPSGLGSDGTNLYVADSETSSIRTLAMDGRGFVRTIVGKGLFVYGDKDGIGDEVRLQHPLDVVFHKGKLYLTDTYNDKIKVLDPQTRICETLELTEDGQSPPHFSEPGGLSIIDDTMYVADTNAHRIRVVDLKTKKVTTLKLEGVVAP